MPGLPLSRQSVSKLRSIASISEKILKNYEHDLPSRLKIYFEQALLFCQLCHQRTSVMSLFPELINLDKNSKYLGAVRGVSGDKAFEEISAALTTVVELVRGLETTQDIGPHIRGVSSSN